MKNTVDNALALTHRIHKKLGLSWSLPEIDATYEPDEKPVEAIHLFNEFYLYWSTPENCSWTIIPHWTVEHLIIINDPDPQVNTKEIGTTPNIYTAVRIFYTTALSETVREWLDEFDLDEMQYDLDKINNQADGC